MLCQEMSRRTHIIASTTANTGPPPCPQSPVSVLSTLLGGRETNVVGTPRQELPVTQEKVPIQLWHRWSPSQLLEV